MEFPLEHSLYRRNNFGKPCVWYAKVIDNHSLVVYHGIVNKTITTELITTERDAFDEVKSRFTAKRKVGYKYITELRDSCTLPVEGNTDAIYSYLDTYLPHDRTTSEGVLLPMLAKTFDDKVFERCPSYYGQYKINGLRCFISAHYYAGDIYHPIRLKFQSREGTFWHSLINLEDYLLETLPQDFLIKMIEENIVLDGELYLPGHSVNEINHFVKDYKCSENKLLQYWCYDVAVEDMLQWKRREYITANLSSYLRSFSSREQHLSNTDRLITLPVIDVSNNKEAVDARNKMIHLGFEGLILRNPNAEYDYGKRRVGVMIKYKDSTDGVFRVLAIKPEGIKRPDIPILICENDINDATFEIHIGGTIAYQKQVLANKGFYIGKQVFVEFGERSGVNKVPFHVKNTYFV